MDGVSPVGSLTKFSHLSVKIKLFPALAQPSPFFIHQSNLLAASRGHYILYSLLYSLHAMLSDLKVDIL